jgi:hypothetical protein
LGAQLRPGLVGQDVIGVKLVGRPEQKALMR